MVRHSKSFRLVRFIEQEHLLIVGKKIAYVECQYVYPFAMIFDNHAKCRRKITSMTGL